MEESKSKHSTEHEDSKTELVKVEAVDENAI